MYKSYVSDTLQIISKNCINIKKPTVIKPRFIELLQPPKAKENAITEEEIKASIDNILANLRRKEAKENDTI